VRPSSAAISEDLWNTLTLETPRETSVAEDNLFDANDFGSAHSSVSTPNEDELHSARSLSESDGGGSRIVLNDVEIGSSYSTPRDLLINEVGIERRSLALHVSASLGWRSRLSLSCRIGQSLHPLGFSGRVFDLPSLNSTYISGDNDVENRSQLPQDQSREGAAGVGSIARSMSESDGTSSDCAVGEHEERDKHWRNFDSYTRAEFGDGDKRYCHLNKVLSFSKGIGCRLNAIAPAAVEFIVEYFAPFKKEISSIAEMQLPTPNDEYRGRIGRTTPIRDSPKQTESGPTRALISLFEFAHQAVRSVSFSPPDTMLLEHALKSSFSVTVPFVAVDVYPPPPVIAYSSLIPANYGGACGFSVVRFLAGGIKYKFISQTNVSWLFKF
jgi:hypothetical protein